MYAHVLQFENMYFYIPSIKEIMISDRIRVEVEVTDSMAETKSRLIINDAEKLCKR